MHIIPVDKGGSLPIPGQFGLQEKILPHKQANKRQIIQCWDCRWRRHLFLNLYFVLLCFPFICLPASWAAHTRASVCLKSLKSHLSLLWVPLGLLSTWKVLLSPQVGIRAGAECTRSTPLLLTYARAHLVFLNEGRLSASHLKVDRCSSSSNKWEGSF